MDWDTSFVPDPQDPETFTASKLDWSELTEPRQSGLLDLTTRLLEIRKTYPDFTDPRFDAGEASSDDDAGWLMLERGAMTMVVNFSDSPTKVAPSGSWFRSSRWVTPRSSTARCTSARTAGWPRRPRYHPTDFPWDSRLFIASDSPESGARRPMRVRFPGS